MNTASRSCTTAYRSSALSSLKRDHCQRMGSDLGGAGVTPDAVGAVVLRKFYLLAIEAFGIFGVTTDAYPAGHDAPFTKCLTASQHPNMIGSPGQRRYSKKRFALRSGLVVLASCKHHHLQSLLEAPCRCVGF